MTHSIKISVKSPGGNTESINLKVTQKTELNLTRNEAQRERQQVVNLLFDALRGKFNASEIQIK